MAALGDERLFLTLEADGPAMAAGEASAWVSGAAAEVVERAAWAKVETVLTDERETGGMAGGRIALNLGHTIGHGLEAADGYANLLHGEAVAYGLRAACRIGVALEVTPPERAARVEALLDRLALGVEPLSLRRDGVLAAMGTDKKHAGGRQRWVLIAPSGSVVRDDVPDEVVSAALDSVLAGRPVEASA
jgi:3-dehydroquinate synthetase